ncbi:preprotein translocase subunit SecA [Candidatus Dojkabacteria bacterium]|nr:preprotein translocase subunit SecA [Candidatus Dojkabacteria bacterium]
MLGFLKRFFDNNEKQLRSGMEVVESINALEKSVSKMSIEDIRKRIDDMKVELKSLLKKVPSEAKSSVKSRDFTKGLPQYELDIIAKLQGYVPEVFAFIRELMTRKTGGKRRHFDVQLLAGVILAQGNKLTELKTGEGKTQVFHLPLALYALTGRGAHLVTVNDYLTRRDGEYAGHIMSELGFSVGVIVPRKAFKFVPDSELKKVKGEEVYNERMEVDIINPGDVRGWNLVECTKNEAYECDIVYATNNEIGFDYLRDNMASNLDRIVQRELYFCIVDEVDSILIDEARTPLIISAPAEKSNELYTKFARIIPQLEATDDYTVDEKAHSAVLTDKGIERVEKILGVKNLWEDYQLAHHLENALKAYTLYKRDDEYIVKDNQVLIVDQFTGRVLPGRRYSEGLHQAIEAKEGTDIKQESKTLATITFQNFFRLYKVLCGGSGTVMTEAEEFYKIYYLDSVEVPTNVPVIRKDMTDRVYKNQEAKFEAVVNEIQERHEKGQPILVGTTSVEKSEYLSRKLDKIGVEHEVLNAKQHEREAQIVAKAGQEKAVTIATNMAGRGTDIRLGEGVKEKGGLSVIGTERHDARRIDNQLRGRSGRQGDPGASRFYVALDDEIMRIQGGSIIQSLMERTNIPDDMPIESGLVGGAIERAQKRMEGYHFDIRNNVVKYDDVMNQQREIFYTRRRNLLKLTSEVRKGDDQEKVKRSREELENRFRQEIFDEVEAVIASHFAEGEEAQVGQLVEDFLDFSDDRAILAAFVALSKEEPELKIKFKELDKFSPKEQLTKALEGRSRQEIQGLLEKITEEMLKAKRRELGESEFLHVSTLVILEVMDQLWTDHLDAIQDLREGIGLRGVAQRDPLVEYKNEAFMYFDEFMSSVRQRFSRRIFKVHRVEEKGPRVNLRTNIDEIQDIMTGSREMTEVVQKYLQGKRGSSQGKAQQAKKPKVKTVIKGQKIGRNDPCPCGSGKKYKKCCGR